MPPLGLREHLGTTGVAAIHRPSSLGIRHRRALRAEPTGLSEFVRTIGQVLPQRLDDAKDAVDRELARKHPDFKAAVNTARNQVDVVSKLADQIRIINSYIVVTLYSGNIQCGAFFE